MDLLPEEEGHKWPGETNNQEIGGPLIAVECHTKLVLVWHLGKRTRVATKDFTAKLPAADTPFQISTDGFAPYVNAIEVGLSDRVE